jgi:two-component system, cell cycle sensor histidine kinase and response regulator CckA
MWRPREPSNRVDEHPAPPTETAHGGANDGRVNRVDTGARAGAADVQATDASTRTLTRVVDGQEHKQARKALRASEMRYRRLFESARDGILILDADSGRIIDVNPYLADLLGYSREDFIGKQVWDFGPLKDVVASKEAFYELQATAYIAYEDLPLETSDGRHIDVGFVSNIYLVDGKRTIQCNIRDITSRKLADKERKSLEEQLRASQKMEAIGGLAGGIAHDFNNLLSVILCYTDFVVEALPQGSPLRDDLAEVEKASKLAVALTRQLLAFSRKQVLQPVPLQLNQVTEDIEKMLRRILGEDIELVHDLAADLGLTMADRSQIEQVIMNLVINARDAMPGGGRLMIVTENASLDPTYAATHAGVRAGPYVMLAVTDTGCGMDADTRRRVFEPFFTTKDPGKGTGLGLSTVYGIVNQSGGHIWVYSEPGHGTTVKVYLPRDISASAPVASTATSAIPEVLTGTETILVVEDEESVRALAERILSAAGYTVLTASNGQDALLRAESHDGDLALVLTDVVMPQLSGRMFAEQMGRLRPAAKILFMSGYSHDASSREGWLGTGTRFLGKPFTAMELTRKVRELLDDGRGRIAAPHPEVA